jgi:SpoIID/LytB domain protein
MTSPKPSSTQTRNRSGRLFVGLGALISFFTASTLGVAPAYADVAVTPSSGTFSLSGAGYGHGHGMSQYGAYGAAQKGLTWQRILAFYYPGTTLSTLKAGTTIRVWITGDSDNNLRVVPSSGLTLTDSSGGSLTLPTGSRYRVWRVTRSGAGMRLHYRTATGTWTPKATGLAAGTWTFKNTARLVRVQMPNGSAKELRGTVSFVQRTVGGRTVNRLSMESYLKSVVPSEMPTSWAANAVRSQSVAARTYAARIKVAAVAGTGYDICDTTSCQVYRGYAHISAGGVKTRYEDANGNAAIKATAGRILKYGSTVAFTQFSSSNGGHSAQGGYAYLSARVDPYDKVPAVNTWARTLTTKSIAARWPGVGTVQQLQVTKRDGDGRWGGRILLVKIIGDTKSVTVSGPTFRMALGLRSTLFTIAP